MQPPRRGVPPKGATYVYPKIMAAAQLHRAHALARRAGGRGRGRGRAARRAAAATSAHLLHQRGDGRARPLLRGQLDAAEAREELRAFGALLVRHGGEAEQLAQATQGERLDRRGKRDLPKMEGGS